MVINEEQAGTVKKIYSLFLSGLSFTAIKKKLECEGIKAPGGGNTWHTVTIKSILSNEKYRVGALLQKKYSWVSIFSSKIICGECGGYFGSKVWHSTDKYRKVIWRCNRKYGKEETTILFKGGTEIEISKEREREGQ